MARPHVVVLPMPYQGHVTPLMELSHRLAECGVDVTFVNTEHNHTLLIDALPSGGAGRSSLDGIRMVAVPDGLADGEDRKDISKLVDGLMRHVPGYLEDLIRSLEASEGTKISWLIADGGMAWALRVGKKLGLRCACFWPGSAAFLAVILGVDRFIQEGVLDEKGWPRRKETLQLAPGMPPVDTSQLPWNTAGAPEGQPVIFQLITGNNRAIADVAEVTLCNSFREAEPGAFKLYPDVLPFGPLFADAQFRKPVGQLFPEDARCIEWLDAQPERAVVYVAFGSFAIFDPRQFEELALGLELTGRPFLWVVRPDSTAGLSDAWLDEFRRRIAGRGMIVSWCSQQQVLAHRAVACFVSHCGWNSTMEGVRNGVPFLCWPYFTDQFMNQSYICDVWRNGLPMVPGPDGVVTKEEVRGKVMRVVGDDGIKERVRALKDASCRCLAEGGSSYENFKKFVDLLKE
ncbi:hypothetical protein PR202_ga13531 [Eleusine coracana subsp. coracana]|uniref:Glycosyltransferase n=1 Tax=Eleusine coracana subsp. coracana TaxID=191504 RepID=A0AAV5CF81_ELECO|nr:hypothetical protein QOZ80_3AG0215470 [Eleusine coracana subsp. coracana]GJM96669.1 hypothetical protein PR202_ga13531 [Eleusine coracana subsp. coracana]